jgi:hypothetical protein
MMEGFDNSKILLLSLSSSIRHRRTCRKGFRRFSILSSFVLFVALFALLLTSNAPILFATALIFNKRVPVVDQWRVLSDGKLTGVVKGHPVIPDGDKITTSPLSNPDFATQPGVTVSTLSGSQYKLQDPQAAYVAQLRKKQQQNKRSIVSPPQRRGTKAVTKDLDLRAAAVARNEERRQQKSGGGIPVVVSLLVAGRGALPCTRCITPVHNRRN